MSRMTPGIRSDQAYQRKKQPPRQTEAQLQIALGKFLDVALPAAAVWFHIPNGGSRHIVEAVNLKRQGVKKGVPDICVLWNRRAYFLELKSEKGFLKDEQRAMHARLQAAGVPVETVRSVTEAQSRLYEFGLPMRGIAA